MGCPASRRAVLLGGSAGLAAGGGALAVRAASSTPSAQARLVADRRVFDGEHQPGVVDDPPAFGCWLGVDLVDGVGKGALRTLLRIWTDDIRRLMGGAVTLTDQSHELADPGTRLTVTVGLGPGAFDHAGLTAQRPPWLRPLPAFAIDKLEKRWQQTDLVVQVCSDDPLSVTHARDQLAESARGLGVPRWVQRGTRPAPREGDRGVMRNAFGQLDGTVNPTPGQDDAVIWHGPQAPRWLRGGTSLVIRRIRMDVETWSSVDRVARENAVGRRLSDGGGITGRGPDAPVDLEAKDHLGFTVVDQAAHVRRAMPAAPHERILRRPYSYDDATTAGLSEQGLVFCAFQADPVRQLLPIQRRLAEADLMNLWTTPVGSAVYAVPGGCAPGEYLAQHLFTG